MGEKGTEEITQNNLDRLFYLSEIISSLAINSSFIYLMEEIKQMVWEGSLGKKGKIEIVFDFKTSNSEHFKSYFSLLKEKVGLFLEKEKFPIEAFDMVFVKLTIDYSFYDVFGYLSNKNFVVVARTYLKKDTRQIEGVAQRAQWA